MAYTWKKHTIQPRQSSPLRPAARHIPLMQAIMETHRAYSHHIRKSDKQVTYTAVAAA